MTKPADAITLKGTFIFHEKSWKIEVPVLGFKSHTPHIKEGLDDLRSRIAMQTDHPEVKLRLHLMDGGEFFITCEGPRSFIEAISEMIKNLKAASIDGH
jgi:hypothetical protein